MSAITACDLCGGIIDGDEPHVTLLALSVGRISRASFDAATAYRQGRHYHATGTRDCFAAVAAGLAAHAVAS